MIRVALRGLAGRKFRTVLTAIAIVLGVAMMSGAYVLTDTIDKAFNAIFVESYADTDVVVSCKDAGISFEGEQAPPPPIPDDVLEQVRGVDGVDVATGTVTDFQTKLLKPDGESIDTGGPLVRVRPSTPRPVRARQPSQPRRGQLAFGLGWAHRRGARRRNLALATVGVAASARP